MSAPTTVTRLRHLTAMSDERGLFEHAEGAIPRPEHGYCTDDNARLLVVTTREPDHGEAHRLSRLAFNFLVESQASDGMVRNRKNVAGQWTDEPSVDDCWGRCLWGLGVAAAAHTNPNIRRWALRSFETSCRHRTPSSRSMAFAALGAAAVCTSEPHHHGATALLRDAVTTIGTPMNGAWHWPEVRLRYANASLAEALVAAGSALGEFDVVDRGLDMLHWLLELETQAGHLSVTGHHGRGPDDSGPQFDQQPIEAAAMADACWTALVTTGDARWERGVIAAAGWFSGDNDAGVSMIDPSTGGCFDGLHAHSVNLNQGAESTLAMIATMQRFDTLMATG